VPVEAVQELAARESEAYGREEPQVLTGYLQTMSIYAGFVTAMAVTGRLLGRRMPERVGLGDLAMLSVASHKLSRVVAKDAVTSPLRAPFTRFVEPAGASEVNEEVRGKGLRHAIGELLTCPFCLDLWAATGFVGGLVLAPKATRLAAAVLTATAAGDALQFGYNALKESG
jgi:hypothetical protein